MKLDQIKSLVNIIAVILIPIVTLIVGNNYTESIKEREIQGKYVELAIDILKNEPTNKNENIRSWAIDVVNLYSGVKINEQTRKDLIKKIPIDIVTPTLTLPQIKYNSIQEKFTSMVKEKPESTDSLGILLIQLSKASIDKGDLFQAKMTLKSVIDHHENDSIKNEAKKILKKLNTTD